MAPCSCRASCAGAGLAAATRRPGARIRVSWGRRGADSRCTSLPNQTRIEFAVAGNPSLGIESRVGSLHVDSDVAANRRRVIIFRSENGFSRPPAQPAHPPMTAAVTAPPLPPSGGWFDMIGSVLVHSMASRDRCRIL